MLKLTKNTMFRQRLLQLTLAVLFIAVAAVPVKAAYDYPFQDPDLPVKKRVADLLSQLTIEEKISLLHQWQPAIPRLGIASFRTGTEALHGAAWLDTATVFPQAIGLGATWDTDLVKKIGSAVGDEVRVLHQQSPSTVGLSVWSPVVDLLRDPRAGRTEEGYSEDPFLTGNMSQAYCAGLKGDDPFYYKTIPTLKHFYAYNQEANRSTIDVKIDDRNKYEYYLESFRYAIEGGQAKSMMTAYNIVNGIPCTVHPDINDVVRADWVPDDFFVVSDAWAPAGLVQDQKYYDDMPHAMAGALTAGVDSMTQDSEDAAPTIEYITAALADELITEDDIDTAVRHILEVRFHTGEFDPDERNPYSDVPEDKLCHPDHAKLARQAAQEAVVLLKNNDSTLPLDKKDERSIAVIGPLADQVLTDFYSAPFPYTKTVLTGIQEKVPGEQIIFTRAVDQIALKALANDKYVTAPEEGGQLTANAESVGKNETFDLYDCGWGQYLFRAHANDSYLTGNGDWNALFANTGGSPSVHPEGVGTQQWFTYQNFRYEEVDEGIYALYNYQVSHWDTGFDGGKYVSVAGEEPYPLSCDQETAGINQQFRPEIIADGIESAVAAAEQAEVAIVVVGNEPMLNGRETIDRLDITLPPYQEELISKVAAVNPNTIVVIVSSYPVAIGEFDANENIKAILYSAHGGQEEGSAIADVLFGDYNPAGRLTMTWYASVDQLPDITDYDIIGGKRTYMYFDGTPLYPFGYGLSYAEFEYSDLELSSRSIGRHSRLRVSVDVKNISDIPGDEVVQLYVKDVRASVKRPNKELLGFKRITVPAGKTRTVKFSLPANELAFWDENEKEFTVEPGRYKLMLGSSSADIKLDKTFYVTSRRFGRRH